MTMRMPRTFIVLAFVLAAVALVPRHAWAQG